MEPVDPKSKPAATALAEPAPELLAHFRDPALRARLVGNLRWHKVPERKVEDIVQTTMADLWGKRHTWPATIEALDKLIFSALRYDRIDDARIEAREPLLRGEREDGEGDAGDAQQDADQGDVPPVAVQAPPVETRDGLAWADRYVQSRPGLRKAFSWLLEMHRGVKAAEIAAREGSREDTVLRAVSRLREQLRTAYKALLLLVAIGSLTWALVWKHGVDDTAKPGPKPTPTVVAPEGPAPAPSQAPEPTASDLRTKAFDECAAHDWNACLADLDLARSIDPAGEADPAVKAAREAATDGLGGKPRAR